MLRWLFLSSFTPSVLATTMSLADRCCAVFGLGDWAHFRRSASSSLGSKDRGASAAPSESPGGIGMSGGRSAPLLESVMPPGGLSERRV